MEKIEKSMENKTYRILIVDDERDVLDSLLMTLKYAEDFNTEIITATNGEVALAKMIAEDFDLVLADFKMPGMSGIDLLTKVSEINSVYSVTFTLKFIHQVSSNESSSTCNEYLHIRTLPNYPKR